ncbi:MAG: integrase family protein [Xanthomonadales bacterium]|nr:integrase family protein [Xanthomonadales bacterium]
MAALSFDFTNTAIDALPSPPTGRVEYRDAKNPALVLRVASSGTKSFCVGRKVAGRFVRVTLGTFKRATDLQPRMTVDMARKELRKAEGKIATGENVNAAKRAERAVGRSVAYWLAEYLEANRDLKPRTRSDYQNVLREFCADWLEKPLADITREHLKSRHTRHGAERSRARANNAVRVLRALYNFAGVVPNPASNPKRKRAGEAGAFLFDVNRKRTLIRDSDLPAWWVAVSELSGRRRDSGARDASDLLRCLLLTGLRAGEACALEWAYVDDRGGMIEIPDTKNRDPHVLPLGKELHSIFRERSKHRRGRYVFGSKSEPDEPFNYNTLRGWFETVAAECGVRVSAHDCRRTFATIAESLDISGSTVKRLLNHRTGRSDVTEGYIVPSAERLRGAMQRIEDRVIELASVSHQGDSDGK